MKTVSPSLIDRKNLDLLLKETSRLNEAEGLVRRTVEILFKFTRTTGQRHPIL
jgi:hypothetical protein